jgi:hypothetical protein
MTINSNRLKYIPGTYAKKRPDAAQLADKYIKDWVKKQLKTKPTKFEPVKIPPAICFSRKIGSGALEITDILAKILHLEEKEVQKILNQVDKEQGEFFKKAFGKKEASPEFDMVINCDFITSPEGVAEIVAQAFKEKFMAELEEISVVQNFSLRGLHMRRKFFARQGPDFRKWVPGRFAIRFFSKFYERGLEILRNREIYRIRSER